MNTLELAKVQIVIFDACMGGEGKAGHTTAFSHARDAAVALLREACGTLIFQAEACYLLAGFIDEDDPEYVELLARSAGWNYPPALETLTINTANPERDARLRQRAEWYRWQINADGD
jgi:hypothetical protein